MGDGCFTFMVSGNGVERGLQRQNSAWLHSHLVDGIEPNGVDPVNIMAGINAAQRSGRKLRATPVDVAAKLVWSFTGTKPPTWQLLSLSVSLIVELGTVFC